MASAPAGTSVLVVLASQWRAQSTGLWPGSGVHTPHLAALAAQGVTLRRAVANHPWPTQSKAALLTGRLAPHNGVRTAFDPLPAGRWSLGEAFARAGRTTAHIGRWGLWRRDPAAPPVGPTHARVVVPPDQRAGFAWWDAFEGGFLLNDPFLHGRTPGPVQVPGYQARVLAHRFGDFLAQARGPWFCVLHTDAPHPPYNAPADGHTAPDPADVPLPADVPRGGAVEAQARRELAGYHAHCAALDDALGRILALVDAHAPDALVVVTSNHGDAHGSQGQFRKGWPLEACVRVPCVVRWPGVLPAGRAGDGLFSLVDLAPTLAARFSLEPPPHADGEDLFHLWLDPAAHGPAARPLSQPAPCPYPQSCDHAWEAVWTARGLEDVRRL